MKTRAIALTVLAVLLGVTSAYARNEPSFDLVGSAWRAKCIIVVEEGAAIDGVLTILECWHGDLKKGEIIKIPKLAEFAPKNARFAWRVGTDWHINGWTTVTCSRMVLFLNKAPFMPRGNKNDQHAPTDMKENHLPTLGAIQTSVTWIEQDEVYAFLHVSSTSSDLASLEPGGISEAEMKARVLKVVRTREALQRAKSLPIHAERADALEQITRSDMSYARYAAVAALGGCGEHAVPALRGILNNESLAEHHSEAVRELAEAGGRQVAQSLTDMLAEEFEFWLDNGRGLEDNWLGSEWELRERYYKVLEILKALKQIGFEGCQRLVAEFREFWASIPHLAYFDEMLEACDVILGQPSQHETEPKRSKPQAPGFTPGENKKQPAGSDASRGLQPAGNNSAGFIPAEKETPEVSRKQPAPPEKHESGESGYLPIFLVALGAFAILLVLTRKRSGK